MTYIETDRDKLQEISIPEMEGRADFSDNNVAQVTEHDAAVLTEKYPDRFWVRDPEDN